MTWKPPAKLLQRTYAQFALVKCAPPSPENLLAILGYAGLLVAAGQAKAGELVRSTDQPLHMPVAEGALRACLLASLYAIRPMYTLLQYNPQSLASATDSGVVKEAISVLNLTCYSAWAMELRRDVWHPNPDWPQFLQLIDAVRKTWHYRKPKIRELSPNRHLVDPHHRLHLWWNYKELWPGHLGSHIYA
jgi:hypothetical protein